MEWWKLYPTGAEQVTVPPLLWELEEAPQTFWSCFLFNKIGAVLGLNERMDAGKGLTHVSI